MPTHIDATGYWIAVALVDEDGCDPSWVQMVMREKGHGQIDIDVARQWLRANPKAMCCCDRCAPKIRKAEAKQVQLSLL